MPFNVTLTYSHDSEPTPGTKSFTGLDGHGLANYQRALLNAVGKLNDVSETYHDSGKKPAAPSTTKGTMKITSVVTKDGADGGDLTLRTPGFGDTDYKFAKGVLEGELSKIGKGGGGGGDGGRGGRGGHGGGNN